MLFWEFRSFYLVWTVYCSVLRVLQLQRNSWVSALSCVCIIWLTFVINSFNYFYNDFSTFFKNTKKRLKIEKRLKCVFVKENKKTYINVYHNYGCRRRVVAWRLSCGRLARRRCRVSTDWWSRWQIRAKATAVTSSQHSTLSAPWLRTSTLSS